MQEMKNHKMISLSEGSVSLSYHEENTESPLKEPYLVSITRDGISVALHLTKEDFRTLAFEMKNFRKGV